MVLIVHGAAGTFVSHVTWSKIPMASHFLYKMRISSVPIAYS